MIRPVTLDSRGWNTSNGYGTLRADESPQESQRVNRRQNREAAVWGILSALIVLGAALMGLHLHEGLSIPFQDQQLPTLSEN